MGGREVVLIEGIFFFLWIARGGEPLADYVSLRSAC